MTDDRLSRSLFQSDHNDTRFQFEIIKELAASVRTMGEVQTKMLERLARIEEHRVHELVTGLAERVTLLEADHNQRMGMTAAIGAVPKVVAFLVALASIFSAIYLAGRAAGVIGAPPQPPVRIEAPVHSEPHRQDGVAGGAS